MKDYKTWISDLSALHLPRYDELNEIPLYLDQILEYINVKLSVLFAFDEVIITQAMINNYVKHKIMPAPVKKRYERDHLVHIVTITILKKIMNIQNISVGMNAVLENYEIEDAYNLFIDYVEESMRFVVSELHDKPYKYKKDTDNDTILLPLKAATLAFSGKLLADYSFHYLISKEEN